MGALDKTTHQECFSSKRYDKTLVACLVERRPKYISSKKTTQDTYSISTSQHIKPVAVTETLTPPRGKYYDIYNSEQSTSIPHIRHNFCCFCFSSCHDVTPNHCPLSRTQKITSKLFGWGWRWGFLLPCPAARGAWPKSWCRLDGRAAPL